MNNSLQELDQQHVLYTITQHTLSRNKYYIPSQVSTQLHAVFTLVAITSILSTQYIIRLHAIFISTQYAITSIQLQPALRQSRSLQHTLYHVTLQRHANTERARAPSSTYVSVSSLNHRGEVPPQYHSTISQHKTGGRESLITNQGFRHSGRYQRNFMFPFNGVQNLLQIVIKMFQDKRVTRCR